MIIYIIALFIVVNVFFFEINNKNKRIKNISNVMSILKKYLQVSLDFKNHKFILGYKLSKYNSQLL